VLPEVPRELATHHGWVASVYLDVSRNHAGAPHEVRLRWEALAEELREQGADDKTVDSAGEAATQSHAQPGRAGARSSPASGTPSRRRWHRALQHSATEPDRAGSAAGGAPPPGEQPELADGIAALLRFTSTS